MSNGQPNELQQLREEVRQLQQRLAHVSQRLDVLTTPPPLPPPPVASAPPRILTRTEEATRPAVAPYQAPVVPPLLATGTPAAARAGVGAEPAIEESFEVRLGTYWLPRLGIVVLLTGLVFLVTWSYRYLGVWGKIGLGYLCAAALGMFGFKLERKMPQFGRVLQAGGLALAYFMSYALHFSETLRVIENPVLGLGLVSLVVAAIVIVADRRQSGLLAGLALGLGYYTSLMSGVDTFTLAANAVLAAAALVFLGRNRWVPISFGAVVATYLAYALWVLKINWGTELQRLIWDQAYLTDAQFQVRAGFLSLYWLLFTTGGLIVKRDALATPERNGLLTLNNALFFVLFTLLVHHAYTDAQWRFQAGFAGALLAASAIAYQRCRPERTVGDTLFVQGVAVATLAVMNYFQGATLVAALALESALLLMLSRHLASAWLTWVARAAFAVAAVCAWDNLPGWETRMIWGATFAAIVGFANARMEKRTEAALYFALVGTALLMTAGHEQFAGDARPWVWPGLAVLVAVVGALMRTRAIVWAAHLPLAWAYASFFIALMADREWDLAPSLALIAVTLAFGLVAWGRARARDDIAVDARLVATSYFRPYAFVGMLAVLLTTGAHCPERWQLAVFTAETMTLVLAGIVAGEPTFAWMAVAAMLAGAGQYVGLEASAWKPRSVGWANVGIGLLLLVGAERAIKRQGASLALPESGQRVWRVLAVVVVSALAILALRRLVAAGYLTVCWGVSGFVLLALGFALKERSYRMAGLVTLAFSLLRALIHDLAGLAMPYRILTFMGLGVMLLLLAYLYTKNREKLAKWL